MKSLQPTPLLSTFVRAAIMSLKDGAMLDSDLVLEQALKLPPQDQVRLIDALRHSVPEDSDVPLHSD